ncbi:MAG TPA: excinuclease ABC subunit UvrA [Chthonomonadales bacterium]|nr:excinuclease ABC subunit UvrA [Chthonomonadales bacterium]
MSVTDRIVIRGARQHNLKNVDVEIPRDRLVVITGISGSGKSSLAFDTLYAEGQRRYVESLSAYARQFLGQMDKPDVDLIEGLSPAVSIDQKSTSRNPRSTVGTVTEIYDYLRLLYARVGRPHCPQCGREISQQTVEQMVDRVMELPERTRIQVLAPVVRGRKGEYRKELDDIRKEGYSRVRIDGRVVDLSSEDAPDLDRYKQHWIDIVVDRVVIRPGVASRLADSFETALKRGQGTVAIDIASAEQSDALPPEMLFSERFACTDCGINMEEVAPRSFSFNSPYGACPQCHGLGTRTEFDPDKIAPDRRLSIAQGAIVALMPKTPGAHYGEYLLALFRGVADRMGFSVDTPLRDLRPEHLNAIFQGMSGTVTVTFRNRYGRSRQFETPFRGVIEMLDRRLRETSSEFVKEELEQYQSARPCPACGGRRLRPESLAVTVCGHSIAEVSALSIARADDWFSSLHLTPREETIARRIVKEIRARIGFLRNVGLDYLTLDRSAGTLAGGEAQRIRLATQIGSGLMGVLYILDEPSIGLHQRDNARLVETLIRLRDLGNTIIVVEHDEETMRAADHLIDVGPGAGEHGGRIVVQGSLQDLMDCPESVTGRYLTGARRIPVPAIRRPVPGPAPPVNGNGRPARGRRAQAGPLPPGAEAPSDRWIRVRGASAHNLRNVDADFPLGCFVCVTGVSGSGKSTLVQETLYPRLMHHVYGTYGGWAEHDAITGVEQIDKVIDIDQSPIGRTPRSNPATYTGTFDLVRELFAATPDARMRGYQPGRFSFNVKGGRCEACRGDGIIKIEMHFLPDVYVPCEVCKGKRYSRETLEVQYKGRSIADVLDMTVSEALAFFDAVPRIRRKLATLHDVGLEYIRLGQPATTLSGGEAQRIKLAAELARRSTGRTIYILDEPTTGLHFADIEKLLGVLGRLVDAGNTVLIIEHNLDVIKTADYVIDLGPEGGDGGGTLVVCGSPEEIAACESSHTGRYLRRVLNGLAPFPDGRPTPAP